MSCKLFVNIDNKKIELLSGNLKDIDKYTCIFNDSNELKSDIGIDENKKCTFYIESKDYAYSILYKPKKDILLDSNMNIYCSYLENFVPKEDILWYISVHTRIPFYRNQKNPMSELYDSLYVEGDLYKAKLRNILKSNYSFYRNILNNLCDENSIYFEIDGFKKYEIDSKEADEKIYELKGNFESEYRKKQKEEYEYSKLELNVLNIVCDDRIDSDTKEEQLQILLDNDQKLLEYYKEKYYNLIYKRNKRL